MMKILKKVALLLLIAFLAIQFIRPEKNQAEAIGDAVFLAETNPSIEIKHILNNSCYDCHSNQTNYPWYAQIAPVSFWIAGHIKEGKAELNFSSWADYNADKKDHKFEEVIETIESGEMPLREYTWTHHEAGLDDDQKAEVIEWAERTRLLYQLDQRPK